MNTATVQPKDAFRLFLFLVPYNERVGGASVQTNLTKSDFSLWGALGIDGTATAEGAAGIGDTSV